MAGCAALPGHATTHAHGDHVGVGGLSCAPAVNMADLHKRVERLLAQRENPLTSLHSSSSVGGASSEPEAIYANLVTPSNLLSRMAAFDQTGAS